MKLSHFFRRKKEENLSLEELSEKAVTQPSYRAEFFERLLSEDLFVINRNETIREGKRIAEKDTVINVATYADGRVPVFTSTDRIFDGDVIKEEVKYMAMRGEDLFKAMKGKNFILNPYSKYGKELLAGEIDNLLKGPDEKEGLKKLSLEKDTTIQIGHPAIYPTQIVNSLVELFSRRPNVNAAYLGMVNFEKPGETPHYVFGMDMIGDVDSIAREAMPVIKEFPSANEFVDFVNLQSKGPVRDYLLTTIPFYKKK